MVMTPGQIAKFERHGDIALTPFAASGGRGFGDGKHEIGLAERHVGFGIEWLVAGCVDSVVATGGEVDGCRAMRFCPDQEGTVQIATGMRG